jgi:signal transduction histidine kinase
MFEPVSIVPDAVADPILLLGAVGDRFAVLDCNRAASEAFGLRPGEYPGRFLEEALPPGLAAAFMQPLRESASGMREIRFEHAEEGGRVLGIVLSPAPDGGGRCAGVVAACRDLTSARAAEREIAELRRSLDGRSLELGRVLETIPLGVAVADDPGCRRVRMNPALRSLLGLDGATADLDWTAADPGFRFLSPSTGEAAGPTPLQRSAAEGIEAGSEGLVVERRDGSRIVLDAWAAPMADGEGRPRGAVGVFQGSGARDSLPELMRRHEARILDAQRLELLGRMAGRIAHDFNNLFTAINGYSELLMSRLGEGDPMRPLLGEILGAGTKAADLTRQLLAFGSKQPEQAVRLDLADLVRESADMVRRLVGTGIRTEFSLPEEPAEVSADPARIRQVLLNLAANSRDAMPQGGLLSIEVSALELPAPDAAAPRLKPGRYVRMKVTDTGTGMPQDVMARIFEPYFTTREAGKATGLGLTAAKAIAARSGGDLRVESAVGLGTSATLYLPERRKPEAGNGADPGAGIGEAPEAPEAPETAGGSALGRA